MLSHTTRIASFPTWSWMSVLQDAQGKYYVSYWPLLGVYTQDPRVKVHISSTQKLHSATKILSPANFAISICAPRVQGTLFLPGHARNRPTKACYLKLGSNGKQSRKAYVLWPDGTEEVHKLVEGEHKGLVEYVLLRTNDDLLSGTNEQYVLVISNQASSRGDLHTRIGLASVGPSHVSIDLWMKAGEDVDVFDKVEAEEFWLI